MSARVILASSAHPVDDKRMLSKVALPLDAAGHRVHVVGVERLLPDDDRASGPTIEVLPPGARLRRAFAAADRAATSGADVAWIADLDVLAVALLRRRAGRWGPDGAPAIVCDVHEHFVSRVHDRLRGRVPRLASLGAAAAFDVGYRALLRGADVVVAASGALAADLARRGIVALTVENAVTDADVVEAGGAADHPLVARIAALRDDALVIVHPGRMDERVDKDAVHDALASSPRPLAFVAVGSGDEDRVVGASRYIEAPPVVREVLLRCIAAADAVFVGFKTTRYNELLASSHKLHEASGLGRQVIVPQLRRWLVAAEGGAAGVLPYSTGNPASLAAALAGIERRPRQPGPAATIDGDLAAAVDLAVRVADPTLRATPPPLRPRVRLLASRARRHVRAALANRGRPRAERGILAVEPPSAPRGAR